MLQIRPGPVAPQIKSHIYQWLRLIASGQWIDALAMLDEPNAYNTTWTEEFIRQLIERDTFGPGTIFRDAHPDGIVYSDPDGVSGEDHFDIGEFNNAHSEGFWADIDMPLNGEWSDLTAQFILVRRPSGYALVLEDLHVL